MFVAAEQYDILMFRKSENLEAYSWLKENITEEDTVLSTTYNASFIAAWAGRGVYMGHGIETAYASTKFTWLRWFFEDNNTSQNVDRKEDFLANTSIKYIYFSELDRDNDYIFPQDVENIERVFDNEVVQIYKVIDLPVVSNTQGGCGCN